MFLKIGHRGARAYETENTLQSFERAITLGANAIELDVRAAKDGKLAVIHDDSLKRVFGADVLVRDAALKELKGLSGGRLLELKEALGFINGKVEKILIELKEPGIEKKTLDTVKRKKLKGRVIIISFIEDVLKNVRELDKKSRRASYTQGIKTL